MNDQTKAPFFNPYTHARKLSQSPIYMPVEQAMDGHVMNYTFKVFFQPPLAEVKITRDAQAATTATTTLRHPPSQSASSTTANLVCQTGQGWESSQYVVPNFLPENPCAECLPRKIWALLSPLWLPTLMSTKDGPAANVTSMTH